MSVIKKYLDSIGCPVPQEYNETFEILRSIKQDVETLRSSQEEDMKLFPKQISSDIELDEWNRVSNTLSEDTYDLRLRFLGLRMKRDRAGEWARSHYDDDPIDMSIISSNENLLLDENECLDLWIIFGIIQDCWNTIFRVVKEISDTERDIRVV